MIEGLEVIKNSAWFGLDIKTRYRLKNREKELERQKKANLLNRGYQIEYRKRNSERIKERRRLWNERNKRLLQIKNYNYRNGTEFSAKDIDILFTSQGGVCTYCREPLMDGFHIDHILPKKRGGTNNLTNIHLVCKRCNLSKGAKTHEEYLKYFEEILND